jgi:hypothetical protein
MSERDYLYSYTIGITLIYAAIRLLLTAYQIYKTPPSSDETTYNASNQ